MLLVDTSAWIEVFRKPARIDIAQLGDLDEIVTCLPVIQELVQGVSDEAAFRTAREAIWSFPMVESPLGLCRSRSPQNRLPARRRSSCPSGRTRSH